MRVTDITTYKAAIMQSRAHRALKTHISYFLRDYGLTMMQWSIIGLVAEAGKGGIRISDLAKQLDTSLAFITTSINVLEAKGMVARGVHDQDSRAKLVRLTESFAPKVGTIEKDLADKLSEWLYATIDKKDIRTYMTVLDQIAKSA